MINLGKTFSINENTAGNKKGYHFSKTNDGKQILREAMVGFLPSEVLQAKKQGFSSPDSSWFKGDSINFVKESLLNPASDLYSYLYYKAISTLIGEHLEGKKNRRLLIWSLLHVNEYLSKNF